MNKGSGRSKALQNSGKTGQEAQGVVCIFQAPMKQLGGLSRGNRPQVLSTAKERGNGAKEMTQRVKGLTGPDDPSSIPVSHVVEEESRTKPLQVLVSTHTHLSTHIHTHKTRNT